MGHRNGKMGGGWIIGGLAATAAVLAASSMRRRRSSVDTRLEKSIASLREGVDGVTESLMTAAQKMRDWKRFPASS